MAAKNENTSLPRGVWTQISASSTAISAATVDNVGSHEIILMATAAETAPTDGVNDGIRLKRMQGIKSSDSLAVLFPGVTSPAYLFALSPSNDGEVFISHGA